VLKVDKKGRFKTIYRDMMDDLRYFFWDYVKDLLKDSKDYKELYEY